MLWLTNGVLPYSWTQDGRAEVHEVSRCDRCDVTSSVSGVPTRRSSKFTAVEHF
jgi:hypothetical protein